MCRLLATALGALIGCTDATAPVDNSPSIHASHADGRRAILDAFDAKGDAYAVSDGDMAAGDYYYRVTDANGTQVSQDAITCRRVHIGTDGTFDVAYDGQDAGAPCQHPCRFSTKGGLTLQLVPFSDGAGGNYRLEVAQDADFADAIAQAFSVR